MSGAHVAEIALQRKGTGDSSTPGNADGLVGYFVGDLAGLLLGGGDTRKRSAPVLCGLFQ